MKVVLLPGLDGTGALFKPLISALPSDIDALVISYPPDENLSYAELTDFVMKRLPEEEEFVLVGESFSGPVAYQVALRSPEYLRSVIFVATFLNNPQPLLLGLTRLFPRRLLFLLPIPVFVLKLFLFGAGVTAPLISLFRKSLKQVSASVLSFRLGEIAKLSRVDQTCGTRAVYIQAFNDKLVPSKCTEAFRRVFTNMAVLSIEGPHFILQANPCACADIIANEIREITNG